MIHDEVQSKLGLLEDIEQLNNVRMTATALECDDLRKVPDQTRRTTSGAMGRTHDSMALHCHQPACRDHPRREHLTKGALAQLVAEGIS